jgi:NTP pyrophosphatase (non-canonical NTP hydrolase)
MLNELAKTIHKRNRAKGFYDREWIGAPANDPLSGYHNPSLASEKLLLVVSEVVEIQDALRDGDRGHEQEEIADVFIRMLDYAAWRGFNIEAAIHAKMQQNDERPVLHGRAVF